MLYICIALSRARCRALQLYSALHLYSSTALYTLHPLHPPSAWFTSNFATKLAKASSDSERWRVRRERNRLLQEHAAVIARRNFEIFDRNAWPKRGGEPPRAPPEQFE